MQLTTFIDQVFPNINDKKKCEVLESVLSIYEDITTENVIDILKLFEHDQSRLDGFEILMRYNFVIGDKFIEITNLFTEKSSMIVALELCKLCDFETQNGLVDVIKNDKGDGSSFDLLSIIMLGYKKSISLPCFLTTIKYLQDTKESKMFDIICIIVPRLNKITSFGDLMLLLGLFVNQSEMQQRICYLLDSHELFMFDYVFNMAEKLGSIIYDVRCYRKVCRLFDITTDLVEKYRPMPKQDVKDKLDESKISDVRIIVGKGAIVKNSGMLYVRAGAKKSKKSNMDDDVLVEDDVI